MKINEILNHLHSWILRSKWGKRNIYIFAGLEPVIRLRKGKWEHKISDCSRCGKCCMAIEFNHPLGKESKEKGCRYLEKQGLEYLCGLGIFRPYGCSIAENTSIEECTVKWRIK